MALRWPKNREADIHKRLKKKSPWFQSIQDPLHGADAKIPDETGVETGTTQLVERMTVTTNGAGVCGLRVVSPFINDGNLAASDAETDGWNWQHVDPVAGVSSIKWGANNETGSFVWHKGAAFSGVSELKRITNMHRVVSAALYVQPEPDGLTNKGEYTLFMQPYGTTDSPDYNNYLNYYKSVPIPLSSPQPNGRICWVPFYRNDWNYKSFVRTNGTTAALDDDHDQCYPMWTFGMVTNGCNESVTFRITVVVNYEFIPTYNTLNVIDASPSPEDAQEVELVETWVQDMDVARPVGERAVSSSPSTVTPQHGETDEGTGFGMFFNVVKEILPFAAMLL